MDDVSTITARHTYGTWRKQKGFSPLHVVDAEGSTFTIASGKKYLDFNSQLMCSNLGHKNQAVIQAIVDQAKSLPFIAPGFATDTRARLAKLLLEVLPRGLDKFFFTTSGTEANEAAIKIARLYTGKYKVIARYSSYHGSTAGAIAATGDFRRWFVEPSGKIEGVIFGPDVNCYRCPLQKTYPDCNVACAEYFEYMLAREGNVAAILVEPVVGTNGILIPPKEYLPRLKEIAGKHKALLIVDEVMSGWGRTGKWFAVDHWGVTPDILTTAKGISGAYVPLGLTATSEEISRYFDDNFFPHGHTYEAHPLTLAPAVAAIEEYRRLDLINKSEQMGSYLKERLLALKAKHRSVGDVRSIGLFGAVDLVKNRETREPFSTMQDKYDGKPLLVDKITAKMMEQGVFMMAWVSHLIVAPPLIITKQELDQGLDALDVALKLADEAVS